MKKEFIQISSVMLTVAVMAFVMSCKDKEEPVVPGSPALSVAPSVADVVFTAVGDSLIAGDLVISTTFRVETNQSKWDVTSNKPWVHLSKSFNRFYLSVDPAGFTAPEPAELTITAGNATPVKISVQQLGLEPTIVVTPTYRDIVFSFSGLTVTSGDSPINPTFTVVTNETTWDAVVSSDQPSWLTVIKQDKTFRLSADVNTNDEPRSATVTITGALSTPVVLNVTQEASNFEIRSITSMLCTGFDPVAQSSTVKIIWGNVPDDYSGTKVTYKKRSTGKDVVIEVDNAHTETTLTDVGNRLEHPDDILYISSVYVLEGLAPIEISARKEQLVLYMASGTRVENTVYDGSSNTFTYTYVNQEKNLRLVSAAADSRVYECNRVAELNPATSNTSFGMTINNDIVNAQGYFMAAANTISDAPESSAYDPTTRNITMRYTVKTAGGSYVIEEMLVPKTTPFEKEAVKPFGDMRAIIPGDNNTNLGDRYVFSNIWDGIHGPLNSCWYAGSNPSTSITIKLQEEMILTRMILWGLSRSQSEVYNEGYNCMKFEIWGVAELDESKLADDAYWDDAADPTGTFKEDWVYLGIHEVERLDKKNATGQEILNRGCDGQHFIIIPELAKPVKYIRFYNRSDGTSAEHFLEELSFFGYAP